MRRLVPRDRPRRPGRPGCRRSYPRSVAPAERTRTRRRFLGADAVADDGSVDPNRLVLSWFGVAGFVMAIGGRVLLLDAWVPRGLHRGYVPTTPDELAALEPDALIIGHGHVDHAADLGVLHRSTSALVIGSPDHCSRIEGRCVPVSAVPGQRTDVAVLADIEITAVGHLHSAMTLPDRDDEGGLHTPIVPFPAVGPLLRHRPSPATLAHLTRHLLDREGGSVLYQIRHGDVAVTWHDTSGPLADRAPEVLDALADLPRTTVHICALTGPNQLANGLRDQRRYIEALNPDVLVPCHHDNWLPGLTTNGARWEPLLHGEMTRMRGPRPEVRFLRDPEDYCRPLDLTPEHR